MCPRGRIASSIGVLAVLLGSATAMQVSRADPMSRNGQAASVHRRGSAKRSGAVYTYKFGVLGTDTHGNASSVVGSGPSETIMNTMLMPENTGANKLWEHGGSTNRSFNVTTNGDTRIVATGPGASEVHNVADLNGGTWNAGYGTFTWELTSPAHSVAQVVNHPATQAVVMTFGN